MKNTTVNIEYSQLYSFGITLNSALSLEIRPDSRHSRHSISSSSKSQQRRNRSSTIDSVSFHERRRMGSDTSISHYSNSTTTTVHPVCDDSSSTKHELHDDEMKHENDIHDFSFSSSVSECDDIIVSSTDFVSSVTLPNDRIQHTSCNPTSHDNNNNNGNNDDK
jgi:hypothetical protein